MLRETQDELIQAGKLAVLGQMAAGVTHELNQPLTALRTLSDNASTLLTMGQEREAQDNLRMISDLCERMGAIVQQLKGFSRKSAPRLVAVALDDAVRQALKLLESEGRRLDVHVSFVVTQPGLTVMADSVRLEQVAVNLLRNAMDAAVAAPGPRRIEVRVEALAEPDGPVVALKVRDWGDGIAPEAFAHLFEPFYTTQAVGSGLGLGLAISSAIAQTLGGRLRAVNAPGGGAEFTLTLPAVAAAAAEHAA